MFSSYLLNDTLQHLLFLLIGSRVDEETLLPAENLIIAVLSWRKKVTRPPSGLI